MVKFFCDACGELVGCDNPDVIGTGFIIESISDWEVKLTVKHKGAGNGNLCGRCMSGLLNTIIGRIYQPPDDQT